MKVATLDNLTNVLISLSLRPQATAVVEAPIQKECVTGLLSQETNSGPSDGGGGWGGRIARYCKNG